MVAIAILATGLGAVLASRLPAMRGFSNAREEALVCDGARDAAPAINRLIARTLVDPGRADRHVSIPAGICAIASTIAQPRWSGVALAGAGAGNYGRCATTLKWIGPIGGTMLDLSSPADDYVTSGLELSGICLDGNKGRAATGLRIRGLSLSHVDVSVTDTSDAGIDMDAQPGAQTDVSLNEFGTIYIDQSSSRTAHGWIAGWSTVGHTRDVNSNLFRNVTIVTGGGDAFDCGAMDANTFLYLRTQGPAGSGTTANPPGPAVGFLARGSTLSRPQNGFGTASDPDPIGGEACRFNTILQAQIYGRLKVTNGARVANSQKFSYPAQNNHFVDVGTGDSFTFLDLENELNVMGTDQRTVRGYAQVAADRVTFTSAIKVADLPPCTAKSPYAHTSLAVADADATTAKPFGVPRGGGDFEARVYCGGVSARLFGWRYQ